MNLNRFLFHTAWHAWHTFRGESCQVALFQALHQKIVQSSLQIFLSHGNRIKRFLNFLLSFYHLKSSRASYSEFSLLFIFFSSRFINGGFLFCSRTQRVILYSHHQTKSKPNHWSLTIPVWSLHAPSGWMPQIFTTCSFPNQGGVCPNVVTFSILLYNNLW